MQWETVIGLEIHVQLNTQSKIFSGSSTDFGQAPNTQANAVDMALPGTLPVINLEAVKKAITFGFAIDAHIPNRSVFDRKNYFYPDSPKGYQTTQMDYPVVGEGHVDVELSNGTTKRIRIHHAHLEEDAGKSLHGAVAGCTGIDLNRAGTPLIEIVTEPDMRNAEEAVAFARKLNTIVSSIGISDGDMSQGSMRFDVNISVRPVGQEEYGTRTETKNLNSFKFMEDCIALEVERQIDILEDGGSISQDTRLYNGDTGESRAMRSKEEANDYRYFPCPDLLPIELSDEFIAEIKANLPELPEARTARFIEQYQLNPKDALLLATNRFTADFFESTASQADDAKLAANWVIGDLNAALKKDELDIQASPISSEQLGTLIARIKDDTISGKIAKQVFEAMWAGDEDGSPDAIIEAKGLKQMSDSSELETMIDDIINNNPKQVENFRAAEPDKRKKMMGFFVGQVMKASKGQANPGLVNKLLNSKLA